MSIRIITDSACDLPNSMIRDLDIVVLPMLIDFEDKVYKDGVDITPDEFYERVKTCDRFPVTRLVPPDQFVKAIEKAKKSYDHVVVITISSSLGGTYASAMLAKEYIGDDDVKVIDSKNVSFSQGLIVREAALMVKKGIEIKNLEIEIKKRIAGQCSYIYISNYEKLIDDGLLRIEKPVRCAFFKPKYIVQLNGGKLTLESKIGNVKQFESWIYEKIKSKTSCGLSYTTIGVAYGADEKNKETFVELMRERYSRLNIEESRIGSVAGMYTGHNCIAVSFNLSDLKDGCEEL